MSNILKLLLLFLSLLSIISNEGDFLVFDLDKKVENRNIDNVSSYVREYLSQKEANYNLTNITIEIDQDVDSIENSEVFLHDQKIISIPSVNFTYKGNEISYKIDSEIDPEIIPNDYFKGKDVIKSTKDYKINCSYVNKAPKFEAKLYENFEITNVVTNGRFNFGLNANNLIVVFTVNPNGTIINTPKTLDNYFIEPIVANHTFKKLFLLKELLFEDFRQLLFGVSKDEGTIYLFEVYDDYEFDTTLRFFGTLDFKREYERNKGMDIVTAISFDYSFIYVATRTEYFLMFERIYDMGSPYLFIQKRYEFDPKEHSKNILDLISVQHRLYLLEEGKGISYFDNINIEWRPVIIHHPYMKKLDHMLYDLEQKASTLFLGAIIDNHPNEGINEFLIEYIISGSYEDVPAINKIFTSEKKIHVDHIVTDIVNKYTYVLEQSNNDLFILNRGIPNFIPTYHYAINLNQYPYQQDRFYSKLSFFAFHKQYSKYSLLFTNMYGDAYFMKNLTNVSQNLYCDFQYRGHYDENIQIFSDCRNTIDRVEFELDGCMNNITYTVGIKKGPKNEILKEIEEIFQKAQRDNYIKFYLICFCCFAALIIVDISITKLCCKSKKDDNINKKNN